MLESLAICLGRLAGPCSPTPHAGRTCNLSCLSSLPAILTCLKRADLRCCVVSLLLICRPGSTEVAFAPVPAQANVSRQAIYLLDEALALAPGTYPFVRAPAPAPGAAASAPSGSSLSAGVIVGGVTCAQDASACVLACLHACS